MKTIFYRLQAKQRTWFLAFHEGKWFQAVYGEPKPRNLDIETVRNWFRYCSCTLKGREIGHHTLEEALFGRRINVSE